MHRKSVQSSPMLEIFELVGIYINVLLKPFSYNAFEGMVIHRYI